MHPVEGSQLPVLGGKWMQNGTSFANFSEYFANFAKSIHPRLLISSATSKLCYQSGLPKELRRNMCKTQHLAVQVQAALQHPGYRPLWSLHCRNDGATVYLQGTIGSFYLKQIAQSIAARVEGVERVVNEIEVPNRSHVLKSSIGRISD